MSKYSRLINFHDFNAFSSIFIIIILITSILYGFTVRHPESPAHIAGGKTEDSDIKVYQTVVEQIHAGKNYYTVAGDELRRVGYPTSSVFNWRLPALAWLLGQLPSIRTGRVIALILATTTLLIWFTVFVKYQYARWQVFFGGLILSGPLMYPLLHTTLFLFHEYWAGTLIALSLALHARGWRYASLVAGLTALFLRELSLPFVFVMMLLAFWEGQRREAMLWFAGILIFSGELLMHWSIVSKLITEKDKVLQGGWIVFGGWPFVCKTAQMHPFLLISPQWIVAIILPLSLLGLAYWRDSAGIRVACTVGIYVLAFMIVGLPFNGYWGLMYAFILPLGLLHVPYALKKIRF